MTNKELADKYERNGYIDIADDMDDDELKQVIAALRAQPGAERTLHAQSHAIECGNLALELQSALAMLTNACAEAGWPTTAEQMAPMNMARAALNKRLSASPPQLHDDGH